MTALIKEQFLLTSIGLINTKRTVKGNQTMRNPVEGENIVIIGSGIGGLSAGIILSLFKI